MNLASTDFELDVPNRPNPAEVFPRVDQTTGDNPRLRGGGRGAINDGVGALHVLPLCVVRPSMQAFP